jgi:hypothetical protein
MSIVSGPGDTAIAPAATAKAPSVAKSTGMAGADSFSRRFELGLRPE